jgi:hypothetical protein
MVKLKDLVEDLELGKVYTDKDRPPFQVKEGQKRQSREITAKFDKAYLNFAKEVRDVIKMIDRYQGDKTDGKIIDKAYSKGLVPLDKLMKSWNSGQQKNPNIDEQTINEAPDNELFKRLSKLQAEIFKLLNNYKSKANVPAIARSFMIGLKNQLKKDKMV